MKDSYELLEQIAGHKFITSMDFLSGYHQIPMAEHSKELTAFGVPGPEGGQYQFNVMPFGLKGAPATFQKFVDDVFRPFLGKFAVVYIDDLAIYSNTREEHLQHIKTILQTMRENQIYAKKKKCFFMQTEIPYLGHLVSEKGIRMDPEKIETIKEWPEIKSIKQLRAFLGLMGYYRKFMANFAHVASPLTSLLKKESMNEWKEEHEAAKQNLIKILTEAPLLQSLDYGKPFTVTTDASNIALGAVLSQGDKPVAFLSKSFTDAERNWGIYDKEFFAVVYALQKWQHYLQTSIPFTVITDNNAITAIKKQQVLQPKQARWIQFLGEFDLVIEHRPGKENKVADAISRRDIYGISTVDNLTWLDRIRQFSAKLPHQPWMTREDDLIYRINPKEGTKRLYIPGYKNFKKLILEEIHQGLGGGHMGYKKTLEKAARHFYWEKMPITVKKFVDSCDTCQRIKSSTQKPYGLLSPIPPPTDKFQTYSMDFIGPLPITKKGYNAILVIVNTFTKATALEPINLTFGAKEIAKIFFKRIISRQGVPLKIISDRDPRFTGIFWQEIFKMLGTQVALSTAFHPQSDGLTERTNRTLETILRATVKGTQDNWDDLLPMAEFAINDSINEATQSTPFELMYGTNPRKPLDLNLESLAPAALDFVKTMIDKISETRDHILRAQTSQKIQADKHRRDHTFQIGDKVMLSTKNLTLPSTHSRKLSPKWIGPFSIIARKHKNSFTLDLPDKYKFHPVFHVNLIKPYHDNNDSEFPDRHQEPPEPVIINDQEEHKVKAILKKCTWHGTTQYLVQWEGYPIEDSTWEPLDNLTNAKDLITKFNRKKTSHAVLIIQQRTESEVDVKVLGQNLHKEGDEAEWGPTTKKTPFLTPNMLFNTTPKHLSNTQEHAVDQLQEERTFESNLEREANIIRTYLIRKFVETVDMNGELLIGYESHTGYKYFYRHIPMQLVAVHTSICDCTQCTRFFEPAMELPKTQDTPLQETTPWKRQQCSPTSTRKPTPAYQPWSPQIPQWQSCSPAPSR